MHGVILMEFNRFVDSRFGISVWKESVARTGLAHAVFLPTQHYPDPDLFALVGALCQTTGQEAGPILEEFGAAIVRSLLSLYSALIEPQWTLLDLLEHTESTIHRVVRIRAPASTPPRLKCNRLGRDEVEIVYDSERKLCSFAKGIVKGLSQVYEEPVILSELDCMLKGKPACLIRVKTGSGPKA